MNKLQISNVSFSAAEKTEKQTGLLGWISCILNRSLRIEGIALRRTLEGRLTLSFPAHLDSKGNKHFYLRPLGDESRKKIENQIFHALGFEEAVKK